MSSIVVTPSVVQDIVDDSAVREFWIVAKEHERPPFHYAGKGGDTRLARAIRLCTDDKITPNSDGSYQVQGSEGRTYRVADSCSCPNSQKASTKWCYHAVGVALYVEWQRRLRPMPPLRSQVPASGSAEEQAEAYDLAMCIDDDEALGNGFPVDDETLPLPLPPTTVDERLAAHTPQEAPMPADASIPEPENDHATTAVLERPTPEPIAVTQAVRAGYALLPSLDARTLEQSMLAWSAQRQVVKKFLQQELVEGSDYYTLRIGGKATKPALSKAGSEKFMALFQLHATFSQDSATWTMLGEPHGTLCYVCHLHTRGGELIGEGRGARKLQQDNGDINKAVKMAQKSAMVDAILRTGALSDVFTQDLDDEAPAAPPAKPTTTSQDLRQRIWTLVQARAPEVTSREAVEAYIQAQTGLELHPNHYKLIVERLEEGR